MHRYSMPATLSVGEKPAISKQCCVGEFVAFTITVGREPSRRCEAEIGETPHGAVAAGGSGCSDAQLAVIGEQCRVCWRRRCIGASL